MTSLIVENDQVRGIRCGEREFLASSVILATGHSARDVYRYLHYENIEMEAKGLAIGSIPRTSSTRYSIIPRKAVASGSLPPNIAWCARQQAVACTVSACAPAVW